MAMGRRTKVTPAAWQTFLTAIKAGNTQGASCGYAGFSDESLRRALARNVDFRGQLEKAEADAEVAKVAIISREANQGNWTAAAWWLERRRPQSWSRTVKVDVEARVRLLAEQYGVSADDALKQARVVLAEVQEHKPRALPG